MTILKETIQNKHIGFACKYVETSLFPWPIRLMRDGPQNWECAEGNLGNSVSSALQDDG